MNTDPHRLHHLFGAHSDGTITPEEHAELQQRLRDDPAARKLWFVHQDVDAGLHELAHAIEPSTAIPSAGSRWFAWRPLAAAAAGLAVGLFSASVVFGIVYQRSVEKRVPLALFEPGFENAQMPLVAGFQGGMGRWSGDAGQIVGAESGISPKEGKSMLRLEPMSKGSPRIFQVLDLQSLSSGTGESPEIEISAAFATAVTDSTVRFMVRAFCITEAPENLDAGWFDRREESIASAAHGMDVLPGVKGWQTVSVKLQVPPTARSLVLFLGVRTPDKNARTAPHFVDDVRVTLITPSTAL